MFTPRTFLQINIAAICGVIFVIGSGAALAQSLYSITDLGTCGGITSSATDVNNKGEVVGACGSSFLYSNGVWTGIGDHSGGWANGINDSGDIVGRTSFFAETSYECGFLYRDGVMHRLCSIWGDTSANAISNSGQIVGNSIAQTGGMHAFVYNSGEMVDLLTLSGGGNSYAYAINASNQVVGESDSDYPLFNRPRHAFLYSNGVMSDLGNSGIISRAYGINDSGQVVGGTATSYYNDAVYFAFLLSNGVLTNLDLGQLGGFLSSSVAKSINNAGQVVGYYTTVTNSSATRHPFIWDEQNGMVDLNSLIDPNSGWTLIDAVAINDKGQIAANGYTGDPSRARFAHALLLDSVNTETSITLASSSERIGESAGQATFSITRNGDTTSSASVTIATADGTAKAGEDYEALNATLEFAAGETSKSVSVNLLNDSLGEPEETFSLSLSNPSGAVLAEPATTAINILDDDVTDTPALSISAAVSVAENQGSVVVIVTRSGNVTGASTVQINTTNGTAVAGSDYSATSSTLTFAVGEISKQLLISIVDDAAVEADETFLVTLANPDNAILGVATSTISVVDNDVAANAGGSGNDDGGGGGSISWFLLSMLLPLTWRRGILTTMPV
jgi:probable HAF family extracellular repeat protein